MPIIKREYGTAYYQSPLTREKPNSQRNQNRMKTLLLHRQGGRLLEIGCGQGGFLSQAETVFDIQGIDISPYAINQIRHRFGDRVQVVNIEQRPLPGSEYQVIAAFNVLEHLRQPDKTVDKIFRALAKGGVLFGSVPNNFGLAGSAATLLSNFFDRTHISTFTPDTWGRIFRHAGFNTIDFFGEVTLGPNHCRYLRGRFWRYLSFNLMFLCEKQPG